MHIFYVLASLLGIRITYILNPWAAAADEPHFFTLITFFFETDFNNYINQHVKPSAIV